MGNLAEDHVSNHSNMEPEILPPTGMTMVPDPLCREPISMTVDPTTAKDIIVLPSTETTYAEASVNIMNVLKPRDFFNRKGEVTILEVDGESLKMERCSTAALRSRLPKYGKLGAYRVGPHGEKLFKVGCHLSDDIAKVVLASEEVRMLRPLSTTHRSPILIEETPKHPKVLKKGYHNVEGGKYIYAGDAQDIPITQAVPLLMSVFDEFDFQTPADRARALMALITPALKMGGITDANFPIFCVEADKSQGGKGFICELIQIIYNEAPSIVTQRKEGVGSFDESLSQGLINGRPFIQMDNIRGSLNSMHMESILTSPAEVQCRVPGRAEVGIDPAPYIFYLTSNGFTTTVDTANRLCMIRIKSKPEDYEFKNYPEGKIDKHLKANKAKYLGAVLAVAKHWVIQGKPLSDVVSGRGRFRDWWMMSDWICKNLLNTNELPSCGNSECAKRTSSPGDSFVRELLNAVAECKELDKDLLPNDLLSICEKMQIKTPGVGDPAMSLGKVMKSTFANSMSGVVVVNDFTVQRSEVMKYRDDGKGYHATKIYRVSKLPSYTKTDSKSDLMQVDCISPHDPHDPNDSKARYKNVNSSYLGVEGRWDRGGSWGETETPISAVIKGDSIPVDQFIKLATIARFNLDQISRYTELHTIYVDGSTHVTGVSYNPF